MDQWNYQDVKNPLTNEIEISELEPHSVYAVRLVCLYLDGKIGNLSEIVYSNKLEDGENINVCFNLLIHSFFSYIE